MRHLRHRFDSFVLGRIITSLSFVALLAACGAPDSSTGVSPGNGPIAETGAETGSVSVFLTDAPSDDFDQILVTIDELQLVGNGPPVTIFRGEETIDLKNLENFSDLFVHADDVPVGTFSKMRLGVTKIQLVRNGDRREVIDVEGPASGKIDLLPKGEFAVRKGVTLVIEIDFDAKKSIHIVGTGSGKYKFRPVVFVSVKDTETPTKLTRVHGTITDIYDDESFELCSEVFMASRDVREASRDRRDRDIGDRNRCMLVEYDDATGIFDADGDPAAPEDLGFDDEVTVIGRFHMVDDNHGEVVTVPLVANGLAPWGATPGLSSRHFAPHEKSKHDKKDRKPPKRSENHDGSDDDDDDGADDDDDDGSDDDDDGSDHHDGSDDDDDGEDETGREPRDRMAVLVAFVIEKGSVGTFLELRGTIGTELDEGDEFDFLVDPGQGFGEGSVLRSLLQPGTRIFTKSGRELDDSDILPDTLARIDGVLFVDSTSSIYKTALLILDIDFAPAEEVKGEIVDIDDDLLRLEIDPDDVSEPIACVSVPEDARIVRIIDREGEDRSEELEFSDLRLGMLSDSFGEFDFQIDCLVADTVLIFGNGTGPIECSENDGCSFDEFCNKNELTCDGAGVCEEAPIECPSVSDPVCGCDGKLYDNACEANAVGVSVASDAECDDTGPVANAGADQSVAGGDAVTLDGSGSTDPDLDPLSYAWTQTAGPTVTLTGADTASPTFTAPSISTTLTFELTVSDGTLSDTDPVDVVVTGGAAPVADAGADQSVAGGDAVTLDGSGSTDPDLDPLSYAWTQTAGPTVTLTGADTASPTFTAPSISTTLTFELTVSDGTLSDTDLLDVVVTGHAAPVADAGVDQSVAGGDAVTLDGSGSTDPDLDPLSYAWTQTAGPTVTLTGASTASPTFTAPSISTTLTFELTVSDGTLSDTDPVDVVVTGGAAPVADAGADQSVAGGDAVTLDGSGSTDPDLDPLSYAWTQTAGPTVTLTGADTASPTFTAPSMSTTLTFELTVSDRMLSDTDVVDVVVTGNAAPVADAGVDQSVAGGDAVTLDGSGSRDPDLDSLSYAWTQTAGPTVTLTGASTASPTFTAPSISTTLTFELTVSDGTLSDTDPVDVVVTAVSGVSYASDVNPIWSARSCTNCHPNAGGLDLGGPPPNTFPEVISLVDLANPASSEILTVPLATSAGGVSHGGGDRFPNTSDPDYQRILEWITQGAPNN